MAQNNRLFTGQDGLRTVAVVTTDKDGNAVGASSPNGNGSTTSTTKSVPAATTNTNILAANTARKRYSIVNDGTAIMYVLEGAGVASTTNYSYQIAPNGYFNTTEWRGPVNAVWATAAGNARVTEYSA